MSEYSVNKRLGLFPISTEIETTGGMERLTIAGNDLGELAEQYGTPLYVYDLATMNAAVETYREALAAYYPGEWGLTYAGKAWLCIATARWVHQQDLWVDCSSRGEMAIAVAAKTPRERILLHGVNKGMADLAAALAVAGTLVVDSLVELERVIDAAQETRAPLPKVWLRLRPGLAVDTHAYRQTGQEDSKFGMDQAEVREATRLCRQHSLPLTGLHFHQGSQFRDPAPIGPALDGMLELMEGLKAEGQWAPEVVCPGGGWAVAYHEDELPHPPIKDYVKFVAERLTEGCHSRGLALPRLQLEPGRSLVARAGVAVYRVGLVKRSAQRRWLLLDGGLTDNPRPALYGTRYSALPAGQPRRPVHGPAWLGGPHCESGDVLIEDLPLPRVQAGELMVVPMSGAYHLSMASNYNGACKPAVLWLKEASAYLIQRREEEQDLVRRDLAYDL
ncbi:MAG: diaminopimelate decarboxylase [Anaerolineae bacterium]